jgi:magnesium chelatase family protein
MGVAVVRSRALAGLAAPPVSVEVHLAGGLPGVNLVGLPETEVREARDRVRAALQNANFEFPARRITVNLAPADLPKESGRFDLPIAVGILVASGQVAATALDRHEFAGELALTGELRAVRGALAMVLSARHDGRAFVLPHASAAEAALVPDATVHPARTLLDVCAHLSGDAPLAEARGRARGRVRARRCPISPTYAASTRRSARSRSPRPGSRAPDVRPARRGQVDARATAAVAAAAARRGRGARGRGDRVGRRALRRVALARPPVPRAASHGERRGDRRRRQPAAAGRDLARAPRRAVPRRAARVAAPRARSVARADGIGAGADLARGAPEHFPCAIPARRRDEPVPVRLARARERPMPLLAFARRHVPGAHLGAALRPHRHDDRRARAAGERDRNACARLRADVGRSPRARRGRARPPARSAGRDQCAAAGRELARHCMPCAEGRELAARAIAKLSLSARAYHRILKVARTIADLAGDERIGAAHVAEAVGYRRS